MEKQPFTILLHIALIIIVIGALATHFLGIQGSLRVPVDGTEVSRFEKSSGPGNGQLPFGVKLLSFDIIYYPGTTTPMNFTSSLKIDSKVVNISMNKIGEYKHWRFCQSGIDGDCTTLSVNYDPIGITVTYIGYILLGIAFIGYFFQRNTPWRSLLRKYRSVSALLMLLLATIDTDAAPLAMQRPLAANLGDIYVYWNDRICPMQTMARDVTRELYGSDSYNGLTADQVLSGWLFYYDEWRRDYEEFYPDITTVPEHPVTKKEKKTTQRMGLIQWLGTGEAFRIYPYRTAIGNIEWLSLTGRRPSKMSLEQWKFMQTTMPRIKTLLLHGQNIAANTEIRKLKEKQRLYAGNEILPSDRQMRGERIYNTMSRPAVAALLALLGAIMFWISGNGRSLLSKRLRITALILNLLTLIYITAIMGMIWWISNHLPLSNGPETMMFMSLGALIIGLFPKNSEIKGALMLVAAMALGVAAMGSSTPRIGSLMPVLGSPLLSVHVMLVMTAYVLFMLMAVLSAAALLSKNVERQEKLGMTNRLILTPAVALLTAGIFIGAVWANQSWGRYWGWDPKETCALVMMLIYAVPLHWGSRQLRCFRQPRTLHTYLLLAIVSVIFTYFGANYLLPGLHSYA